MRSLLLLLALPGAALAQGTLGPSAAPAPSMRTLDQIEARIPLQAGSPGVSVTEGRIQITATGSYYLTGNVTVASGTALSIGASDVTVDLNGFTLSSTATASGYGIFITLGKTNVTIRNGHIRSGETISGGVFAAGPGFTSGIYGLGLSTTTVEDVSVVGVPYYGILLNAQTETNAVRRCFVDTCAGTGITATRATDCTASQCGSGFLVIIAARCSANSLSGTAINATCAADCDAFSAYTTSIAATVVRNSNVLSNATTGASLTATCASNCTSYVSAIPGFTITGAASFCRATGQSSGNGMTGRFAFGCTSDRPIATTYSTFCH